MRRNKFAFEEAEVLEQVEQVEEPIVMQDLEEDLVTIDQDQEELGDDADAIESANDDAQELQGYSDIMEKNLDEGLSPDAVEAIQLATESICKRLGIVKKNTKISLEAFEELKNSKESTRLAFEENNGVIVRTLKAVWEAIKKAYAKVKEFLKKLFGFGKKIDDKATDLCKETERHKKENHKVEPIIEPHATAESSTKDKTEDGKLESPKYVGDTCEKNEKGGFANKQNTNLMLNLAKALRISNKKANFNDINKALDKIGDAGVDSIEKCSKIIEFAISEVVTFTIKNGEYEGTNTDNNGTRTQVFFDEAVMIYTVPKDLIKKKFRVYNEHDHEIDSFLVEICSLQEAQQLITKLKNISASQKSDEANIAGMTASVEKLFKDTERFLSETESLEKDKQDKAILTLKGAAHDINTMLQQLSKIIANFYKGVSVGLDYAEKSLKYYA